MASHSRSGDLLPNNLFPFGPFMSVPGGTSFLHSVWRSGFIPRFQQCAVRCDEAKHCARIQAMDMHELETLTARLDRDRVAEVGMRDFV